MIRNDAGDMEGFEAVIDKDRTAALLAQAMDADVLLMLTDVAAVMRDWGAPNEPAFDDHARRTGQDGVCGRFHGDRKLPPPPPLCVTAAVWAGSARCKTPTPFWKRGPTHGSALNRQEAKSIKKNALTNLDQCTLDRERRQGCVTANRIGRVF